MMHIFKDQILQYENVLSYRTKIQISDVNKMIGFIQRNTDALDLKICGNIAATVYEKENISGVEMSDIEFLIPVNKKISESSAFKFKPVFKLVNAVKIRHEGSMKLIERAEHTLDEYITQNAMQPVTPVYYLFIQSTEYDNEDNIVDLYKGISENIL
jgi:effector-binding domain-containing protein